VVLLGVEMTQNIRLGVEVTDSGSTKKTEASIDELNKKLADAKVLTKELQKELKALSSAQTGGTSGSRKMSDSVQQYGAQRGVAGLTGASARDFANQAQGLDGLVRLYATYAANVFALGAAFRGLSTSIDTDNMIKGLDQLGAAVGRNLGGLSKRFAELSGGAISMREAMQAVAQTTSGGMSTKNIERLAKVATSASMALGVAMPDAVNRLSRGITKLEPELLDELGIMTRIEPAIQAYGRELGKAASQLTDFERRQAFANAVLSEGEAKFGNISDLAANPYDKLLASLKNLLQTGSSVINTVLGPIVNLLASSPTALAVGMGALATMILRQAVPAIGQIKQGLTSAAEAAAEIAQTRARDAQNAGASVARVALEQAESLAEREIDIQDKAQKRIEEIRGKSLRETSLAYKLINKSVQEVTESELKGAENHAKSLDKRGRKDEAAAYREITAAIKAQQIAEDNLIKKRQESVTMLEKQAKGDKTSVFGITQALAIEAQTSAVKKTIIANAAYNASLIGVKGAFTLLKAEVESSGLALTRFQMIMLKTQAGAAIFASAIATIGTAFIKLTNLVGIIGTVIAVFTALDYYFSSNAKEASEFASALTEAEDSSKNLHRTLEQLNKTMAFSTIEGISAMAQALDTLTNSTSKAIAAAKKNKDALTGIWSIVGNEVSRIWGGDVESKLAATLTQSTVDVLDLVANSGLKDVAREKFKEILGIDSLDTSSIKKAIADLSASGKVELEKLQVNLTASLNNSSSRLQSFRVATDASTRAYQQFIQATSNTSPLFRVGASLQNVGVAMFDIAREAELSVVEVDAVIMHLSKVPDAGAVFGREFISGLVDIREEFIHQGTAIEKYKKLIIDLEKEMTKHTLTLPRNYDVTEDPNRLAETGFKPQVDAINVLRKLVQEKKAIEEGIVTLQTNQSEKARKLFVSSMDTAFNKGAELIRVSFGQSLEKAAIAIGKASLLGLTGANRAMAENALSKQELDIQLKAIETNIDLILSQETLKAALDEVSANMALLSARESGKVGAELKVFEDAKEAASIFSHIINSSGKPDFATASGMTGDSNVALMVRSKGISIGQKMAEQNEAKILVRGQMQAQGIAGGINVKNGQLEDTQKLLNLEMQLKQASQGRAAAVAQIVTILNEESVRQQVTLEREALITKQKSEQAAIDNSIAISTSNEEKAKQEGFKVLIMSRQEQELSTQAITASQRLIAARVDTLTRIFELTKAINQEDFTAGFNRLEVLNAENQAYSQLYRITETFSATQTAITAEQKAQLDFVKAISEATLDLSIKQEKARSEMASLNPTQDASKIKLISNELARQERLTKAVINNAKSNLSTQTKILEVNKKAALQQATYNRLLNNSNEIATSLASAFGDVGSAIGGVVESFAKLTVNTDKGAKAIEILVQKQAEMKLAGQDTAELENDIGLQRQRNTQDQILGYANIASSAKNMFEEQSTGYQLVAALEKAMFVAHIAMTLKQLATDAMATATSTALTQTRIASSVAEAGVYGVTAVVKAIASLPPPFNFIAGAAVAAVVAGLLASIGGSSKVAVAIPGGISAEDMQSTQGTGRSFVNGKLADSNGGALGNAEEKVSDIANSLLLIQTNTSITSNYGRETLEALQAIETNTKDLASSIFKSTNVGKLTSGFGTVEKAAPAASTGLLSMFIPSTSKSTEIIDKGIEVVGLFNDILQGTAEYLEYETIQKTKVKSGFLGIGGKTKIKISSNTKDLSQEAQETVISLFGNLANAAILASQQVLGQANRDVQNILDTFIVSFKSSGMGLSGEEFAEAILAESTTVMNEIIAKAMPNIDQFRQLGEGFSGTLIRLATTIEVVNDKAKQFGTDLRALGSVATFGLNFYDDLVNQFGGLESFSDKTSYFFDNFFSESEKFNAKTADVVSALQGLVIEGTLTQQQFNSLTDGIGNAREEYRLLTLSQDLTTEAGRRASNTLFTLAPAIAEITEEYVNTIESVKKSLKDILEEADLTTSKFTEILNEAILGNLEDSDIGANIATVIKEGFFKAMSSAFVEQVSNTIINNLISPILSGAINLSAVGFTSISGLINAGVEDITNKANTLSQILSNPAFKQAMTVISTSISQVVTKVNTNAKSIDATFSSLKVSEYLEELNELNKELDSRIIEDSIAAERTRLDLLNEQVNVLQESADKFRSFNKSLIEFKQSLLTGSLTPLTPLDQYATIKAQLDGLVNTATTATSVEDRSAALDQIQQISSSFLEISRLVYSSGTQYTNDFNYVQSILDSLISSTDIQATIDEQQLAALNLQIDASESILISLESQLDALNNVDSTTASMLSRIEELGTLLSKEYAKGNTNIAEGFSVLDTNFNNVLTIDELKASGMASDETLNQMLATLDKDGNGQISRLEALKGAANGTFYTLQSITPILEAINSGIIDFNTGLTLISQINQSNTQVGGSAISGNYTPSGGTGIGYTGSSTSFNSGLGGYISNGTIYGINGKNISLDSAKANLMSLAEQVGAGTTAARDVYNLLTSWGVNSQMTAQILGTTKQDVLDWFKFYDPSIPAFEKGINQVPQDMFAYIHKNERILPAADNEQLMQSLSNRNDTNQTLIEEIRKLNTRIGQLETAIIDGAVLNAEATNKNTEVISSSVKDSTSTTTHNNSIKKRVAVG
jgi:hypothetical protein